MILPYFCVMLQFAYTFPVFQPHISCIVIIYHLSTYIDRDTHSLLHMDMYNLCLNLGL